MPSPSVSGSQHDGSPSRWMNHTPSVPLTRTLLRTNPEILLKREEEKRGREEGGQDEKREVDEAASRRRVDARHRERCRQVAVAAWAEPG